MARNTSKKGLLIAGAALLLISLLMYLGWLVLPGLTAYAFWIAVLACGLILAISRRNNVRLIGALILLVSIGLYLGWLTIPGIMHYSYWFTVLAFGVLVSSSR